MTAIESKENLLQDVFRTTYREYYPIVYGSIYTKVGSRETADDITQDVFLAFFEKLETIENIRGWLFKTVRFKLFSYYRKEKHMTEDLATLEATGDIALTYINGFKDTRIIIKEALEIITDDTDRNIFDLFAVLNYSYREVSQEIGLSYKQVRTRYTKIERTILDYLKDKKGITKLEDLL